MNESTRTRNTEEAWESGENGKTEGDPMLMIPPPNDPTTMVAGMVNEIMRPLLESIGKLLQNNTEAMEQIASSQDVIRNRMEALEKQVRLQTPVTDRQARYLADAAKGKALEILTKRDVAEDKKAVTKLAGIIRKSVMARYGVGNLREIPRCEYDVAMKQIGIWNNAVDVIQVVKEARARGNGKEIRKTWDEAREAAEEAHGRAGLPE